MKNITLALLILILLNIIELMSSQAYNFLDSSKKLSIPAYIGFSNNSEYLSNQSIFFVDNNFHILPINDFGNSNFNLIKFDGIVLNSLYDKSLDNTMLFNDDKINYLNNINNYGNHFINNSRTSLLLVGGSNFGNANLFIKGNIGEIEFKTRNNYYVTNGFNNPKGVIFNPISEISKQSFQSTLSLNLQDSKSLISYNQIIITNKSENNFKDIDNFFKDASSFNSIFSLKYLSRNSEFIRTNGQLFLKYSNFNSTNTNFQNLIKSNELSYGLNLGLDLYSPFFLLPTMLNLKLSQGNSDLTLLEDFYQFKIEDFNFSVKQEFNLYKDNISQLALSYNFLNPIDESTKGNYSKISGWGLEFNYHHYLSSNELLNDNYINFKISNELPAFKYLFSKSITNDSSILDFNYQNYIQFGSKTRFEFLDFLFDFNISYVRFNEYFKQDSFNLGTILNESWIMNIDFALNYWKFNLEAKYRLNLLGKEFRTDNSINNLPEMIVDLKLDFNVSSKTVISFFLRSYNFNYKNNLNEGYKGFSQNTQMMNLKIEQNISENINLILSINNILDEQIPLFPNHYSTGFNYLGGITIML